MTSVARPAGAPAHAEFLRGVTAVLAHMKSSGEAGSTLYNETVQFIGAKSLIAQARKDGTMRWSGLDEYQRHHTRPAFPLWGGDGPGHSVT